MSTSDGRNDIVAVTGESVAYYRCSNGDSTVQDDQKNYTSYKVMYILFKVGRSL